MLKKIALKKNYVLASAAPILMRKYYLLPLMSDNFMHTYSQLFCNFFATKTAYENAFIAIQAIVFIDFYIDLEKTLKNH